MVANHHEKNLVRIVGARADEPAVSAPIRSPEERKLDAIWSNYFRLTHSIELWQHYVQVPPVSLLLFAGRMIPT